MHLMMYCLCVLSALLQLSHAYTSAKSPGLPSIVLHCVDDSCKGAGQSCRWDDDSCGDLRVLSAHILPPDLKQPRNCNITDEFTNRVRLMPTATMIEGPVATANTRQTIKALFEYYSDSPTSCPIEQAEQQTILTTRTDRYARCHDGMQTIESCDDGTLVVMDPQIMCTASYNVTPTIRSSKINGKDVVAYCESGCRLLEGENLMAALTSIMQFPSFYEASVLPIALHHGCSFEVLAKTIILTINSLIRDGYMRVDSAAYTNLFATKSIRVAMGSQSQVQACEGNPLLEMPIGSFINMVLPAFEGRPYSRLRSTHPGFLNILTDLTPRKSNRMMRALASYYSKHREMTSSYKVSKCEFFAYRRSVLTDEPVDFSQCSKLCGLPLMKVPPFQCQTGELRVMMESAQNDEDYDKEDLKRALIPEIIKYRNSGKSRSCRLTSIEFQKMMNFAIYHCSDCQSVLCHPRDSHNDNSTTWEARLLDEAVEHGEATAKSVIKMAFHLENCDSHATRAMKNVCTRDAERTTVASIEGSTINPGSRPSGYYFRGAAIRKIRSILDYYQGEAETSSVSTDAGTSASTNASSTDAAISTSRTPSLGVEPEGWLDTMVKKWSEERFKVPDQSDLRRMKRSLDEKKANITTKILAAQPNQGTAFKPQGMCTHDPVRFEFKCSILSNVTGDLLMALSTGKCKHPMQAGQKLRPGRNIVIFDTLYACGTPNVMETIFGGSVVRQEIKSESPPAYCQLPTVQGNPDLDVLLKGLRVYDWLCKSDYSEGAMHAVGSIFAAAAIIEIIAWSIFLLVLMVLGGRTFGKWLYLFVILTCIRRCNGSLLGGPSGNESLRVFYSVVNYTALAQVLIFALWFVKRQAKAVSSAFRNPEMSTNKTRSVLKLSLVSTLWLTIFLVGGWFCAIADAVEFSREVNSVQTCDSSGHLCKVQAAININQFSTNFDASVTFINNGSQTDTYRLVISDIARVYVYRQVYALPVFKIGQVATTAYRSCLIGHWWDEVQDSYACRPDMDASLYTLNPTVREGFGGYRDFANYVHYVHYASRIPISGFGECFWTDGAKGCSKTTFLPNSYVSYMKAQTSTFQYSVTLTRSPPSSKMSMSAGCVEKDTVNDGFFKTENDHLCTSIPRLENSTWVCDYQGITLKAIVPDCDKCWRIGSPLPFDTRFERLCFFDGQRLSVRRQISMQPKEMSPIILANLNPGMDTVTLINKVQQGCGDRDLSIDVGLSEVAYAGCKAGANVTFYEPSVGGFVTNMFIPKSCCEFSYRMMTYTFEEVKCEVPRCSESDNVDVISHSIVRSDIGQLNWQKGGVNYSISIMINGGQVPEPSHETIIAAEKVFFPLQLTTTLAADSSDYSWLKYPLIPLVQNQNDYCQVLQPSVSACRLSQFDWDNSVLDCPAVLSLDSLAFDPPAGSEWSFYHEARRITLNGDRQCYGALTFGTLVEPISEARSIVVNMEIPNAPIAFITERLAVDNFTVLSCSSNFSSANIFSYLAEVSAVGECGFIDIKSDDEIASSKICAGRQVITGLMKYSGYGLPNMTMGTISSQCPMMAKTNTMSQAALYGFVIVDESNFTTGSNIGDLIGMVGYSAAAAAGGIGGAIQAGWNTVTGFLGGISSFVLYIFYGFLLLCLMMLMSLVYRVYNAAKLSVTPKDKIEDMEMTRLRAVEEAGDQHDEEQVSPTERTRSARHRGADDLLRRNRGFGIFRR